MAFAQLGGKISNSTLVNCFDPSSLIENVSRVLGVGNLVYSDFASAQYSSSLQAACRTTLGAVSSVCAIDVAFYGGHLLVLY